MLKQTTHPVPDSSLPQIAFLLGMGRSGTTMLTNMLNVHEGITATPENEFILYAYSTFLHRDYRLQQHVDAFANIFNHHFSKVISIWKPGEGLKSDIAALKEKNFQNICKLVYLNYPLSRKNKDNVKWVVDKNPVYSLHINTLNRLFPGARYIVIVRDYRDNILSRKKYSDENTPLLKLAAAWNLYYDCIFRDLSKNKIPYHLVRYEDLAGNPGATLRSLCDYMEVPYSDNMLNFQELSGDMMNLAAKTLSEKKNAQAQKMHANLHKKVNTDRVNAYVKELDPGDAALLDHVCRKYARQFNYPARSESQRIGFLKKLSYHAYYFKARVYVALIRLYYSIPLWLRPGLPESKDSQKTAPEASHYMDGRM